MRVRTKVGDLVRVKSGQHQNRTGRIVMVADDGCWYVRLCDDWSVCVALPAKSFVLA
jgi:hypothetical protein